MMNVQRMREKLLSEKRELEASIESMESGALGDRFTDSTGELSAYDQHSGDAGSELFEREKDMAVQENEHLVLEKVNRALAKIEEGTYGYCDRCGNQIEKDRLETIPYATFCSRCEKETEHIGKKEQRPVEEDVTEPPFGRSFRDDEDYTGFDGEDSWQSVARWGTANSPQDVPDAIDTAEAYVDADEPIGAASGMDAIIDVDQEGIGDPEDIYPDPVLGRSRRPHRERMRGTKPSAADEREGEK